MKVATIRTCADTRAARIEDDHVVLLEVSDVRALLDLGADWRDYATRSGRVLPLEDVSFAPVVPRPEKIVVLGWNYTSHVLERKAPMPVVPALFAKYWRALIGAYDSIAMPDPDVAQRVDPEVELGVIVGRNLRGASVDEAEDAIAGYMVCNDMSVRDWQRRSPFPMQGKTWEKMTPAGPWLVTPDEVDHARDLRVECLVDGEQRQDSRTSDQIFSPAQVVSYMSTILTLVPGDMFSMGTPSGVGDARTPPVYLQPGQMVTTRIEGLGECVNRAVLASELAP
jgi:acylpyruvate hydrolase